MKTFTPTWSALARNLNDKCPANSLKPKSESLRSLVFQRVIIWLGIVVHVSCIFQKYTSDSAGLASRAGRVNPKFLRYDRYKADVSGSWSDMKNMPWEISFTSHFHLHFHHSKKIALFVVVLFFFSLIILRTLYLTIHSLWTDLVQLKYTSVSERPKIKLSLK